MPLGIRWVKGWGLLSVIIYIVCSFVTHQCFASFLCVLWLVFVAIFFGVDRNLGFFFTRITHTHAHVDAHKNT